MAQTTQETAKNPLLKDMEETFLGCLTTAVKKNADYAGNKDPYHNFKIAKIMGVTPAKGIAVRVTDKISRLGNLLDKEPEVSSETIFDTIDDAINYLAILKSVLKNGIE